MPTMTFYISGVHCNECLYLRRLLQHIFIFQVSTVLQYDKILVMSKGSIVEFGHPEVLAQDPNSLLSGIIHDQSS